MLFRRRHNRWIEELYVQLERDRAVTSSGTVLTLPAAASDLRGWILDHRKYKAVQYDDWQQVISDFKASVDNAGPKLIAATGATAAQLLAELDHLFVPTAISNRTAPTRTDRAGRFTMDETVRTNVANRLHDLETVFRSAAALIACWHDLVAICRNPKRRSDAVCIRRDTLWALAEQHNLDLSRSGVFGHLAAVMTDNPDAVHEELDRAAGVPHEPRPLTLEPTGVEVAQRLFMCEQVLSREPDRGDCIVWLRLGPASLPRYEVSHGQVTFYNASYLSSAVRHPRDSRDLFTVYPQEVLTPQDYPILRDDEILWEDDPNMVYARVCLAHTEVHSAIKNARMLTEALTAVNHPTPRTWKLLNGSLLFIDGQCASLLGWGPRDYEPDDMYYPQNDWMDRDIELMSRYGRSLDSQSMHDLHDALTMSAALKAAATDSPQAVVMAAVRAIEHVNVWVTGGAGGVKDWADFACSYFKKGHSRVWFVQQIGRTMQAAMRMAPDPSHDAASRRELQLIENSLRGYQQSGHEIFDVRRSVDHVDRVAALYENHWLARDLNELAAGLQTPASRYARLEELARRFDVQLRRLKRLRNAAVHGGPVSDHACHSVAVFASAVAHRSLDEAMRALLSGQEIRQHVTDYRIEQKDRWQRVRATGDIDALFAQPETGTVVKAGYSQ